MSDQQTWVEALNIKPELLTEWSSQAPAGKPILVYCIEEGLVDYGEYMRWAQQRYGLAVLQPNYFQATFDPSQLEQAKLTGAWQAWIFPVENWDGVTFVACVEPPHEPEAPTVRYVLADPRAMKEAWGGTMTTIRSPQKSESEPPALPKTESLGEELPAGMSASPKPFVLDLDNATFNIGPVTEIKPMPEVPAAPKEEEKPFTENTSLTLTNMREEEETDERPSPKVTPPPPLKTPELKIVTSAPATKTAPAAAVVDEDGAVKSLFTAMRERYQASIIMKCTDQNARLYQWDKTLNPTVEASKVTVNLSYPTFMRIVSKTNLPYHGYLVDSPAHHEFFNALGLKALPVCVTAIPIRFEDVLWGIVVAFGTEENQKMESLNFAQDQVDKLIHAVGGRWSKAS